MKKTFLILALTAGITASKAQRQLPGQKGVELSAGFVSDEKPMHDFLFARVAMTINKRKGNYQFLAVEYNHKKQVFETIDIPIETYNLEGGYSFYLVGDWRKTFSVHLGVSAVGGYEVINKSQKQLYNGAIILNEDHFVYGGGMNLSLETYLGDKVILLLRGHTKYLLGTSLEHLRPGLGLGIRYIF